MTKSFMPGTRWFALSARELALVVVGVGIPLLTVGAIRMARSLRPPGHLSVDTQGHALIMPARLNVNTAEDYELTMLPGIGPKTAAAIINHRRQHGPFGSLDDLTEVSGIGPKTVERIRPHAMCAPVRAPSED